MKVLLFFSFIAFQASNCERVEIPDGLVAGIIASMKKYEQTKSCESFIELIKKSNDMEKILCSTGNEEMCAASTTVSQFFMKLLFEKLPRCVKGLIFQSKNKNINSFSSR